MAAISTFDQWQKDVFFSAAEEVQESADAMESVYRMWVRERSDEFEPEFSDELQRELHTTLGTAKWQLEEFERAVSLSYKNVSSEDNTSSRHREFIAAIHNKISHIEKAIKDLLLEEGKQPFQWVQLDDEERDDFENFLSMVPKNWQGNKEKYSNHGSVRGFKKTVTIRKDAKYVVEVAAKEPLGNQDEVILEEDNLNGQRRLGSLPDVGAWKIVIADEEDADRRLIETRPEKHNRASSLCGFLKLKWFKNSFRKAKSGEHIQSGQGLSLDLNGTVLFTQGINGLSERSRSCFGSCKDSPKGSSNQETGRVSGLQRHFRGSQSHKRSLRGTLFLVLTIFFIEVTSLKFGKEESFEKKSI